MGKKTDSKRKSADLRGILHQRKNAGTTKHFFLFYQILGNCKAGHAFQAARGYIFFNN